MKANLSVQTSQGENKLSSSPIAKLVLPAFTRPLLVFLQSFRVDLLQQLNLLMSVRFR